MLDTCCSSGVSDSSLDPTLGLSHAKSLHATHSPSRTHHRRIGVLHFRRLDLDSPEPQQGLQAFTSTMRALLVPRQCRSNRLRNNCQPGSLFLGSRRKCRWPRAQGLRIFCLVDQGSLITAISGQAGGPLLLKKGLQEGRKPCGVEFRDWGSFGHQGLMEEVAKLHRALVGLPGGMGNVERHLRGPCLSSTKSESLNKTGSSGVFCTMFI